MPSNYSSGTDSAGDPTVTLGSAPAASSTVIGWLAAAGSTAVTPPSGYTELDDQVFSSDLRVEVVYDAASAATSAAWTTGNTRGIGLLIEVQEASGAARVQLPRVRRFQHMIIR